MSQIDITKGRFGLDLSSSFWYDSVYLQKSDNRSPASFNPASVPFNSFPRKVRAQHGAGAEIVNGFVYGSAELGSLPVSFRFGRHSLLWGESLFFADNGIAAGQAPVDYLKFLSGTNSCAKTSFMPVTQGSASLQLPHGFDVEAYYQLEWRETREPGVGSFLGSEDFLYAGGERYLLASGQYLLNTSDRKPNYSGQFGAALHWSGSQTDYGFYALRYTAKTPEVYFHPGIDLSSGSPPTIIDASRVDLAKGKVGTYELVYPEGIEIYGLSASTYLGDSNVAVEISGRRNMPLVSTMLIASPGQIADASRNPLYAVGNTLHAQASTITSFGTGAFWDLATLSAEVAASQRLSVRKNAAALDPDADSLAIGFRGVFEPTYFSALPNLDLNLSLGIGYGVAGNSSTNSERPAGIGDFTLGLGAVYRVVWSGNISFTHYLGRPEHQPLADRDFLRFSIQRTF